ncbi:hypothetical protein A6S26_12630 [Nostoc sp. ATCC 43529]|nr:hypothetical protein A6S26_12630 [Nostoc sp. ATCC 43529]
MTRLSKLPNKDSKSRFDECSNSAKNSNAYGSKLRSYSQTYSQNLEISSKMVMINLAYDSIQT